MPNVRRLRRSTWLAVLALLGWVLMPAFAGPPRTDRVAAPWAEICSAAGSPAQPDGGGSSDRLDHCPLCTPPGHGAALPPSMRCSLPTADRVGSLAPRFADHPPPPLEWPAAQPRAPPAHG